MSDEGKRTAERAIDLGDAIAVQRVAVERARVEDPLEKLRGLVERARGLYADPHFTLADVLRNVVYARARAEKTAAEGRPAPGYLWVNDRAAGTGKDLGLKLMCWADTREPWHLPAFQPTAPGAPYACALCGALAAVAGRCVMPALEGHGIIRERVALTWWRGSMSVELRPDRDRSGRTDPGLRHFALIYWDGDLGVVAVGVGTGTSRQKVSSVFRCMKRKKNKPTHDMSAVRAWALEEARDRVLMTTDYAEGRGAAGPIWDDVTTRRATT